MEEYARMHLRLLHFMNDRFDRMRVEFINKHGIIMVNEWFDGLINRITKKQWLVVEIYLNIHRRKVQEKEIRISWIAGHCILTIFVLLIFAA